MLHNLVLFQGNRYIGGVELAGRRILVEKAQHNPEHEFVVLVTTAWQEFIKTPDSMPQIFWELSPDQQAYLTRRGRHGSAQLDFSSAEDMAALTLDAHSDLLLATAKFMRILRHLTWDGGNVIDQNEIEHAYRSLALPVQRQGIRIPGRGQGTGHGQGWER